MSSISVCSLYDLVVAISRLTVGLSTSEGKEDLVVEDVYLIDSATIDATLITRSALHVKEVALHNRLMPSVVVLESLHS